MDRYNLQLCHLRNWRVPLEFRLQEAIQAGSLGLPEVAIPSQHPSPSRKWAAVTLTANGPTYKVLFVDRCGLQP